MHIRRLHARLLASSVGAALLACSRTAPGPAPSAVPESSHAAAPKGPFAAPSGPVPEPAPAAIPTGESNALHKHWFSVKYGPKLDQLGWHASKGEGWVKRPTGFVPVSQRELLVMDTVKRRLVWFNPDGKIQRTLDVQQSAGTLPVGIAVAEDGTLAVASDFETAGVALLDANGQAKGQLRAPASATDLYAVGNDFYAAGHEFDSEWLGNARTATQAPPNIHGVSAGSIPGHLSPDARRLVVLSTNAFERGEFVVTVKDAANGSDLWRRVYRLPSVSGLLFDQSDRQGRIYIVVVDQRGLALVCIDGESGDLRGRAALPTTSADRSTEGRPYKVLPEGGLLYHLASDQESSFEWYSCF